MIRSILDTEDGVCYICGKHGITHKHHIFGAANRKYSEQYGLYVFLCPPHHNMSDKGVHFDKKTRQWLQSEAQEAFEQIYGHDKFMQVFGRSYL